MEISTQFETAELEDFLKSIWGDNSPLAQVVETYDGQGKRTGTGFYAVIRSANKIVGCAGIKFVDEKLIEVGSLAIAKDFRGRSLSRQLFAWKTDIVRDYVRLGYSVITYATLGSTVMNFIIPKLKEMTNLEVYPLNAAIGVIPVSQDKVGENINGRHLVVDIDGKSHTSTLAIIATSEISFYEEINEFAEYNLSAILPVRAVVEGQINFPDQENTQIGIPGTRLVINKIRSTNPQDLPIISTRNSHQILVPILSKYAQLHGLLGGMYSVAGFSLEEDVLHAVYMNSHVSEEFRHYLRALDDRTINRWLSILKLH